MGKKVTLLANLPEKKMAKIISIRPGHGRGRHGGHRGWHTFYQKMCTMGIREGQHIQILSKQPFGPITIQVGKCKMTIGQGMAHKILVEEL